MCFLLGGNRIEVNSKQRIRMRIREQWNWWVIHIWFYWPTKAWAMIIWVSRACWVRRSHVEWISSQVVRWAYKYIYIYFWTPTKACVISIGNVTEKLLFPAHSHRAHSANPSWSPCLCHVLAPHVSNVHIRLPISTTIF